MLQGHASLQSYPTQPEDLPAGQNSPDDDGGAEAAGASKNSEGDNSSGDESEAALQSTSRRQAQEATSPAISGSESDDEPLRVRAKRRRHEVGSSVDGGSGPVAMPAPSPEKVPSAPASPLAAVLPGTSSSTLAPRKAILMRPVYSIAKALCNR